MQTAIASTPTTVTRDEPVARYDYRRPHGTPLPEVLMQKLRTRLHHRRLKSVLTPPVDHESARKLFRDACTMLRAGMHEAEVDFVLRVVFEDYYRPLEERDFERAVANAAAHFAAGDTGPQTPRYARPNFHATAKVIAEAPADAYAHLRRLSPVPNPDRLTAGAVIDRLFPGSPLLCFARTKNAAETENREYFRDDEAEYQFVVPSPMRSHLGKTQDGRSSPRTLQNVGPRQYVVVEFDGPTLDEQAAIHLHLGKMAPLAVVVFSGSKSLHGWYSTAGADRENVQAFMSYAASLGADTATFNPVQLVRTPNAYRDNGVQQSVVYLAAGHPGTPHPVSRDTIPSAAQIVKNPSVLEPCGIATPPPAPAIPAQS